MAPKNKFLITIISIVMILNTLLVSCSHTDIMVKKEEMTADGIVRLSKIEVYPEYLDEYLVFAIEVGTKSLI